MDQNKGRESTEVKIGHSLSEAELQHLARRSNTVQQCLNQHGISCSENDMPNIAVLGSGGGLRAMIGLLGSLCQLKEEGLLDCIKYLSGVSGSTWCMASLYKEPNWSTKLDALKENIVQRLAGGGVSWSKIGQKLVDYITEKDNISLTDVWAALIVSNMVKEIDEHKISEQRGNYTHDPYPIYTVIDKQCKYDGPNADVWFEITPDESGYSLSGAFVDSTCLRSRFKEGKKIKDQPEIDMLYLQGLCGSAIADMEANLKFLYEELKQLIRDVFDESHTFIREILLTLVKLTFSVLNSKDPTVYLQTMKNLQKDKHGEIVSMTVHLEKKLTSEKTISKEELNTYILGVCNFISDKFKEKDFEDEICKAIGRALEKIVHKIWGTTYNFLYKMKVKDVNPSVLHSEKREYEDAGVFLNSPYFSVLRQERDIKLIISLDFSAENPFETVVHTATLCKDLHIPFPEVVVPAEDADPQDFYVFRGYGKAPTVIHIPLFNVVNCNGKIKELRSKYPTSKMNYSTNNITDLMEKAGENIKNNKEKLLKEIENVIKEIQKSKLG